MAVLLGTSPGTVAAQPPVDATYEGVIPGTAHRPPAERRLGRARGRGRRAVNEIVTWPGFQPNADGSSRFFVQTTGAVSASVTRTDGRIEVVFPDCGTHLRNSRRWLETMYFETPVTRARFERRGRTMVLVMHLRADVSPTITSGVGEGGYYFTYIEFGPGHYLPDAPPAPIEPRGSLSVVSVGDEPAAPPPSPAPAGMDDERPPPVSGPRP